MFKEIEKKLENAKTIINSWSYEKGNAQRMLDYWKQQKAESLEADPEADVAFYNDEIDKAQDLLDMFDDVEKYIIKMVKQAI